MICALVAYALAAATLTADPAQQAARYGASPALANSKSDLTDICHSYGSRTVLDSQLAASALREDDGSESFAWGIVLDALTMRPPVPPRQRNQNPSAWTAFRIALRTFRRRSEAAMEAAMKLLQDERIVLPQKLMVEEKVPASQVQFKPSARGKVSATTQVLPALVKAFDRYALDPQHTDASRRFLLFLLRYHGPEPANEAASLTSAGRRHPTLDINLKTPDSLASSHKSLLMNCLEQLKLDIELCSAMLMPHWHSLRPYLENPLMEDRWHGGYGLGKEFDDDLYTGGSFLQQVVVDNSVPIIKRLFGLFSNMRANRSLMFDEAVKVVDDSLRASWNGNVHICLPQIFCASKSARLLAGEIQAAGTLPESLPMATTTLIETEITQRILQRLMAMPQFGSSNFFVHQPARSCNILHMVAMSNSIGTLKMLLEHMVPGIAGVLDSDTLKETILDRLLRNKSDSNHRAPLADLKRMLGWRDRLMRRTPLHQSAALHGTHSQVYREMLRLDQLLFANSTAELKDGLGFRHSDYSAGAESWVFHQVDNSELMKQRSQLATGVQNDSDCESLIQARDPPIVAIALQENGLPFRNIVAQQAPRLSSVPKFESSRPTSQDEACFVDGGRECLRSGSTTGGWNDTILPANILGQIPPIDTGRCDILEVFTGPPTPAEMSAYIAQSRPVVFRGAALNWTFRKLWMRDEFVAKYGHRTGRFARIPYASSFNFEEDEYRISDWMKGWGASIRSMESKLNAQGPRVTYGTRKNAMCGADGHCEEHTTPPVPVAEHLHNSSSGTPTYLFSAEFTAHNPGIKRDGNDAFELLKAATLVENEEIQPDLQFYLGPAGSGSPHHWHGPAVNALAWGTKHWLLFHPNSTEYGTIPALDYFRESLDDLRESHNTAMYECTQGPGDLLFVPMYWGHSTLNLESSIGMALEFQHKPDRFGYEFPLHENTRVDAERLDSAFAASATADDRIHDHGPHYTTPQGPEAMVLQRKAGPGAAMLVHYDEYRSKSIRKDLYGTLPSRPLNAVANQMREPASKAVTEGDERTPAYKSFAQSSSR